MNLTFWCDVTCECGEVVFWVYCWLILYLLMIMKWKIFQYKIFWVQAQAHECLSSLSFSGIGNASLRLHRIQMLRPSNSFKWRANSCLILTLNNSFEYNRLFHFSPSLLRYSNQLIVMEKHFTFLNLCMQIFSFWETSLHICGNGWHRLLLFSLLIRLLQP